MFVPISKKEFIDILEGLESSMSKHSGGFHYFYDESGKLEYTNDIKKVTDDLPNNFLMDICINKELENSHPIMSLMVEFERKCEKFSYMYDFIFGEIKLKKTYKVFRYIEAENSLEALKKFHNNDFGEYSILCAEEE